MNAKGDTWTRTPTHRNMPYLRTHPTISVVDGPPRDDPPAHAHRVPFGFGVRDRVPVET